jgi:predicted nucleotidyltransferase
MIPSAALTSTSEVTLDPVLSAITGAIAEWATTEPLIDTVWLFGSRLGNDYRRDSDLDVAVRLRMQEDLMEQAALLAR